MNLGSKYMDKPNVSEIRKAQWLLRDTIVDYFKDRLHNYTFQNPYVCDITIGEWCAYGLSSLDLPSINAMCYDEEYDDINVKFGDNDYWDDINEMCLEDLIELLDGFEL